MKNDPDRSGGLDWQPCLHGSCPCGWEEVRACLLHDRLGAARRTRSSGFVLASLVLMPKQIQVSSQSRAQSFKLEVRLMACVQIRANVSLSSITLCLGQNNNNNKSKNKTHKPARAPARFVRLEQMTRKVKQFPHTHEDLSSEPRGPHKARCGNKFAIPALPQ